MKISEKLKDGKTHISIEVFPPKTDAKYPTVIQAVDEMARLNPSYMSVTYGAGGGTSENTVRIASHIKHDLGMESLAHLTCVSSTKAMVKKVIGELKDAGIENVLALRGDIPENSSVGIARDYRYASELIREIRESGDFCIGAACYPEGHVESQDRRDDIRRLKMSGSFLPERFLSMLDRFGSHPAAMKQAGIAYATEQIVSLIANGIQNIHIYSMNKPEVAEAIMNNLSEMIEHE